MVCFQFRVLDTFEQQALCFQGCQKEAGNIRQEWRKEAKRGKKKKMRKSLAKRKKWNGHSGKC